MSRSPFGSAPIKAQGQPIKYDIWEEPEESRFYRWAEKMYPQAIKEFNAVRDIERSVEDGI